jgi:hypothetical protein
MARTNPLIVSVILLAGVTTARGQSTEIAGAETQNAAETQALQKTPSPSAAPEDAASAAPAPARVSALPLKRGFYVASDTPCRKASNATTLLVTRDGINGSRDRCTFRTIEKTGATTYRVTSECSDGGRGMGPGRRNRDLYEHV